MIFLILIILFIIYLSINIIFIFSAQIKLSSNKPFDNQNKISVVIAAKNECDNIEKLIKSLCCQDYPKENYEVIIVDDESTDATFANAIELTDKLDNFHIYKVQNKTFPAKKGVLNFGINLAVNPFILITDADCQPSKEWIKSCSAKFSEGFDFIFGDAPFNQTDSLVNKISCYENLRSSLLTFSAVKLQIPYSAAARNFGFSKSSFEKIKGYSNTLETIGGDDDLLLREAVKNKLEIGIVLNEQAFVFSDTKRSFGEYLRQKSRHAKTSAYYLIKHKLVLGLWHSLNLIFLFSPVLFFVNPIFIIPLVIKILIDLPVVLITQKRFGYQFKVWEIFYLQIFYEIFLIVNFINANIQKDTWQ